jgi:nitrate/nitrite-specific signal transduction histidine kinase
MRERIALLDGHLEINSARGAGTSVAIRLPVQRSPAHELPRVAQRAAGER